MDASKIQALKLLSQALQSATDCGLFDDEMLGAGLIRPAYHRRKSNRCRKAKIIIEPSARLGYITWTGQDWPTNKKVK